MINVEQAVCNKFPAFGQQPEVIKRSTFSLLRKLTHEQEINQFLEQNGGLDAIAFIDNVLDYFNVSYSISNRDKVNIPGEGRVVIIANHPIGSLDGLAILRLVSEVRPDVKIIANDMLMAFDALQSMIVPVDNMGGSSALKSYRAAIEELNNDHAVILFPAGEVSRARPSGVKDTRWRPGFLKMARRAQAPIVPIHINAKNSLLFYGASMLFKPLGTALLAKEMFNKRSSNIHFSVGEPIAQSQLLSDAVSDKRLIQRLKKHLYKLGKSKYRFKSKQPLFVTEKTIAHPEDRSRLLAECKTMQSLGETRDGNRILLSDYHSSPVMMRELGRLRELTFRKVGEGTGSRRDLDDYDRHYQHLLLWDHNAMELAGAYRLGDMASLMAAHDSSSNRDNSSINNNQSDNNNIEQGEENALYTRSLFDFKPAFRDYLNQGIELGRSFVSPKYWGKASLDYLWQGIGAYLKHHPGVRYLIGPVTISASFDKALIDEMVFYYQCYFSCPQALASAKQPHFIEPEMHQQLLQKYHGLNADEGFKLLQQSFSTMGEKVPVLFKQYAALFEQGGFQLLAFSVDPDFSDCIDGLFMADLQQMKASKRKRYLGDCDQQPIPVEPKSTAVA